jgi:carboxyl-terminal processing protease
VQKTDSGRTVYGGGGITPDDKFTQAAYSAFQVRMVRPRYTFVHFANEQFAGRDATLPKEWKPDADTLAKFQEFLKKNNIAFSTEEFAHERQWISDQIQIEMYSRAFDRKSADQLTAQVDKEVQKAMVSMPMAQGLLDEARRVLARRK